MFVNDHIPVGSVGGASVGVRVRVFKYRVSSGAKIALRDRSYRKAPEYPSFGQRSGALRPWFARSSLQSSRRRSLPRLAARATGSRSDTWRPDWRIQKLPLTTAVT